MSVLVDKLHAAQASKNDGIGHISEVELAGLVAAFKDASVEDRAAFAQELTQRPDLARAVSEGWSYDAYKLHRDVVFTGGVAPPSPAMTTPPPPPPSKQSPLPAGPPFKATGEWSLRASTTVGGDEYLCETGGNRTRLDAQKWAASPLTDAGIASTQDAQRTTAAKMAKAVGHPVSTPPSMVDAKAYFQSLISKGASADAVKREFQSYMNTYYADALVDWQGKDHGLTTSNFEALVKNQPTLVDGRKLIDCEGYSALTQLVLGDLKRKDGQPMFDITHGMSTGHVLSEVLEHGVNPPRGFSVSDGIIRDVPANQAGLVAGKPRDEQFKHLIQFAFDNVARTDKIDFKTDFDALRIPT